MSSFIRNRLADLISVSLFLVVIAGVAALRGQITSSEAAAAAMVLAGAAGLILCAAFLQEIKAGDELRDRDEKAHALQSELKEEIDRLQHRVGELQSDLEAAGARAQRTASERAAPNEATSKGGSSPRDEDLDFEFDIGDGGLGCRPYPERRTPRGR